MSKPHIIIICLLYYVNILTCKPDNFIYSSSYGVTSVTSQRMSGCSFILNAFMTGNILPQWSVKPAAITCNLFSSLLMGGRSDNLAWFPQVLSPFACLFTHNFRLCMSSTYTCAILIKRPLYLFKRNHTK